MKTLNRVSLILVLAAAAALGQTFTLTQTTLAAAALATDNVLYVTSATGINVPSPSANVVGSQLYIISPGNPRGEIDQVRSVNGTAISVNRSGKAVTALPTGALVMIGQPNWFQAYDPSGACTLANTYIAPWVNTLTGAQWQCSAVTNTWVPSWGNPYADSFAPTAAVASAAGLITPSGPLFHVTGTSAITGFNMPVGFSSGSFTIIPDAIFTVTHTNNVGLASTAVVGKPLTYTYDPGTALFYPSY